MTFSVNRDDLLCYDYFDFSSESEQEEELPISDEDFDYLLATVTL